MMLIIDIHNRAALEHVSMESAGIIHGEAQRLIRLAPRHAILAIQHHPITRLVGLAEDLPRVASRSHRIAVGQHVLVHRVCVAFRERVGESSNRFSTE